MSLSHGPRVFTRHMQHTVSTWQVAADALIARGEVALGERIKRLVEGEPDDRPSCSASMTGSTRWSTTRFSGPRRVEMNVTRLREFREARLLTQGELAKKAELTAATVSRLETGKTRASFSTVRKLASPWVSSPRPS